MLPLLSFLMLLLWPGLLYELVGDLLWLVLKNELVVDLDEYDSDCCSCRSELWWPVESTDPPDDDEVVNKMGEGSTNVCAG